MKNKGFTLAELLGAISILAILAIIVFPLVINQIKKSRSTMSNATKELIFNAADIYMKNNPNDYHVFEGAIYFIEIKTLVNDRLLKEPLVDAENGTEIKLTKFVKVMITEALKKQYLIVDEKTEGEGDYPAYACSLITNATSETCFSINSKGEITGYNCQAGNSGGFNVVTDIVIPCKVNDIVVRGIASGTSSASAFYNKGINSVKFPPTMDHIGSYAFNQNNLKTISFPSSMKKIGAYAFVNNKLTGQLVLSSGIETVDTAAFMGKNDGTTNAITSVTLNNGLKTIGQYAFAYNKLSGNLYVPDSVLIIEQVAFAGTANGLTNVLTNVIFGNNLNKIGDYAFQNNKISSSLTFPNTLQTIGKYAFAGVNSANTTNQISGVTFGGSLLSIGDNAFAYNKIMGSVVLPDTLTQIGTRAFCGYDFTGTNLAKKSNQITNVNFGKNVKTIGSWAFGGNDLQSLTLPNGILAIEDSAFRDNIDMSGTIVIPNSLTKLGFYAFGNNKVTGLTIGTGLTSIPGYAFDIMDLSSVTIPANITAIEQGAFNKGVYSNVVNKSNNKLTSIINKTGRSFNWSLITGSTTASQTFETGTIIHGYGNIAVTK